MMYEELAKILKKGGIVFFGGAGVSTESGIPDFRSSSGLYASAETEAGYCAEDILSAGFFKHRTAEFYDFYKSKILHLNAQPNKAHYTLAELERRKCLNAIITQNIDGLHQRAGSKRVYELHGSVHYNYCTQCGKGFSAEYVQSADGVPSCECGGIIKPDVVLYDEPLNSYICEMARAFCECADTLIVGGTSLRVYPAADMVRSYMGSRLIIINSEQTPMDKDADLVIRGRVGEVLDAAVKTAFG